MTKQVIVMRKDLNMRKGKMVAQGAHASLAAFMSLASERTPERLRIDIEPGSALDAWLNGRFTKICVGADTEEEVRRAHAEAAEAGLPAALIVDAGLTEFAGPTLTCCAIGPAASADIDMITRKFKLL